MKAKIRGIQFGEGKLIVNVGFYFSEGEEGYDECYREVMEIIDDEPVGTGEWKLYPFNTLGFNVPFGMTKQEFKAMVLKKLRGFKEARSKVANLQSWIGFEIEE